jgi:hypothetical protein
MKQRISNYHDLVVEKQRLHQRLTLLRRDVDNEIHEIKRQFRPVQKVVSFISGNGDNTDGKPDTPKESLWKMGATLGMEMLVGPKLARAGFLTRLFVPPLLRGISSSLVNRFRKKK